MNGLNFYTHFGELLMLICSFVAAVIGYLNRKKHASLRRIYIYPLASMAHTILLFITGYYHITWKIKSTIMYCAEDIFLVIEFFIIYYFFLNVLKLAAARKLLLILEVVYVVMVFSFSVAFKSFFELSLSLYTPQTFFILIPVITYYFELVKWPPHDKLSRIPSFWIATGVTIYFAGTAPLFLLKDFIFKEDYLKEKDLYLINFVAYSIMFLFITKAYLCPKRDTP